MPMQVNMKRTIAQIMIKTLMSLNMYMMVLITGPSVGVAYSDMISLVKPMKAIIPIKKFVFNSFSKLSVLYSYTYIRFFVGTGKSPKPALTFDPNSKCMLKILVNTIV